jgi:hypothetical protein
VLPALWEERDDSSWRVTFLSLGAEILGKSAFQIKCVTLQIVGGVL